jgi:hypothetical protein
VRLRLSDEGGAWSVRAAFRPLQVAEIMCLCHPASTSLDKLCFGLENTFSLLSTIAV